jgi:hypothetical protein
LVGTLISPFVLLEIVAIGLAEPCLVALGLGLGTLTTAQADARHPVLTQKPNFERTTVAVSHYEWAIYGVRLAAGP